MPLPSPFHRLAAAAPLASSTVAATATLAAALCASGTAGAATFVEAGHLVLNTDVARIALSLDTIGTDVLLYTDSYSSGVNFDPEIALWSKNGSDYTLVDTNDDADPIVGSQSAADAGFSLSSLAAGDYLLTLSASSNDPVGPLLSDGYQLADGEVATPIATWNQPGYDINTTDSQKGTFWEVRLDGVDRATVLAAASPVPEPSIWLLMALGLAGMGWWRMRASTRG